MPKETEKRWLVDQSVWQELGGTKPVLITQGYVAMSFGNTVRVRVTDHAGVKLGSIECKGNRSHLTVDDESVDVPPEEAARWLELFCAGRTLCKVRYRLPRHGQIYDVDVFQAGLEPLIIAEAELEDGDKVFTPPRWCREEISHSVDYSNFNLATAGLPKDFGAWYRSHTNI